MKTTILFASLSVLAISGCKKTPEPDTKSPSAHSESAKGPQGAPEKADVEVDRRLADLCDLPEPRFAYDSSGLTNQAESTLGQLVQCLLTGPAKNESVELVGHADPRGAESYNLALGQRRAGSVATYLAKRGVPEGRMATASRGELDATGDDESGWQTDRRVDIRLAR